MVTLCEEPKCVNLVYKICHARPPTESKANNKHPNHHKHIDRIRPHPSPHELWWPIHCILHHNRSSQTVRLHNSNQSVYPISLFGCNALCYSTRQELQAEQGRFFPHMGNRVRTDILDHRCSTNLVPLCIVAANIYDFFTWGFSEQEFQII